MTKDKQISQMSIPKNLIAFTCFKSLFEEKFGYFGNFLVPIVRNLSNGKKERKWERKERMEQKKSEKRIGREKMER